MAKKTEQDNSIVINQIQIRSVDRSRKDIASWRAGLVNAESVLNPNRKQLYDVYEEIVLDGHLSGIIEKRISAVANKCIRFKRDDEEVEELEALIRSTEFRRIVELCIESELWGISGIEFLPGAELRYNIIPRKHIKPKWKVISFEQNGHEGVSYDGVANLWIIGEPDNLGTLLKCAPYAIYKKGNTADWAQYIEIFGQPVRIIKYDAQDGQTKAELKQVVDEAGSSLALMIPKQADFEMMDGKHSNGDGKLQAAFMDALNNEMSILVLGNTETTGNTNGGSNAKAETQRQDQLEITKSDIVKVTNLLNSAQFLNILKTYGYPVEGGMFEFDRDVNLEEVKSRMDIISKVKAMGVPVDDEYVYEISGIPKPSNYKQLKKAGTTPQPGKQPKSDPKPEADPKPIPKNQHVPDSGNEHWWTRLRLTLADFFDPAPKD